MKLVNRVWVFTLAALAIVLVIYSGMFYAIVRTQLVRQFEQESQAALNSLVAAVEVEPEEVKWQPLEHTIALGAVQGPDEVQWVVIGDGNRLVEKSRNVSPEIIARSKSIAADYAENSDSVQPDTPSGWQILHRRLEAPAPDRRERELDEFDELVIVVAHSTAPLHANLRRLLLLAGVLPVATWLIAGAAGHWFSRRALQPVLDMAEQARAMTGANFHSRLRTGEANDELGDLARAFNTLLDHQQRAFEQQRRFTGDAAHELRTPLTVLLGQIDVALRRARSPEEYANTLGLLRDQAAQLQTIVESLLFLARAEEDATLPNSETFSLATWLPEYMQRWHDHPRRKDIQLQCRAQGESLINASPALLARLLDNLVENALKYSAPGSEVEVSLQQNDAEVIIAVQDHGCGIAAEDQAEIFRPFFRTRAAREAGIAGTGLGLPIAARIAAAWGGRLHCSSEVGQGSRFHLHFQAVPSSLALA